MLTLSRYTVDSAASVMELKVRTTLHGITGTSRRLRGFIEAAWDGDGALALSPAPKMHLEVSVDSISTGNDALDKQMREMVGSRSFPNILADLRSLQAGTEAHSYAATGEIQVKGTTRAFAGKLSVRRNADRVEVAGETAVDMRLFGITPPRLLVLSVQPEVALRLQLVAKPA